MTYDPNGEFDTLLSDGLRRRAAAAARPSRGFSDVRRRYRRRRQQQVALGLVPAVAGLGWLVTRPRADQPLQPSGGGLVDCGDTTVAPTYPDTTMVSETTTWGSYATSTTITFDENGNVVDANGFPLNTLPSSSVAPPPWTGATSTVPLVDSNGNRVTVEPTALGTTTTSIPGSVGLLILDARTSDGVFEPATLYAGARVERATSPSGDSVVLATEASRDLALTVARDMGILDRATGEPYVTVGLDASLVPAGVDLTGVSIIVILGDDAPPPASTTIEGVTPTTVCEPVTTTMPPSASYDEATTVPEYYAATKVQVANCSTQNGVAQMMSSVLTAAGFTTADATNGTCDPKIDSTYVIYNEGTPGAYEVARTVAAVLGGVTVEAAILPIKTESGAWAEGSGVVVLLGNDLAGKTLEQITMPTTTMVLGTTTTSISG